MFKYFQTKTLVGVVSWQKRRFLSPVGHGQTLLVTFSVTKRNAITINLPKVRRENIAFEVTNETFCLKSSKDDGSPIEYFGCWILANPIDPKKAKATFKNGILTVSVPLISHSEITKVQIEQKNTTVNNPSYFSIHSAITTGKYGLIANLHRTCTCLGLGLKFNSQTQTQNVSSIRKTI